jgi:predicted dienelactone hydrolase
MRKLMLSMLVLAIVHAMSSVVAGSPQTPGDAIAPGSAVATRAVRVGHSIKSIIVGTPLRPLEDRPVDVHLWYPADPTGFAEAPKTFYTSRLYGEPLAGLGDPLSWRIEAQIAREQAAIDPAGRAYPVIVFSHGATNDPIDYAYTLELIAAAGFVVAAPAHANNTQDDVRMDHVNTLAATLRLPRVFSCRDGLPSPCARTNVARSMADRVRDISAVLAALPGWYGDRVDVSHAGLMGHSRGTVTALVAAGGSVAAGTLPTGATMGCGATWGIDPLPGIKAVMGLAIGAAPITNCINFANVTVPVRLVAGARDANTPPAASEEAHNRLLASTDTQFFELPDTLHRSFDSTYCAQMQAAGAVAGNPRAILDKYTFDQILTSPVPERATQYCSLASFTNPVDITPLVRGFDFDTPPSVPTAGVDTETVKQWVIDGREPFKAGGEPFEGAVAFFSRILKHDPTPPAITYSISGSLGSSGWYTSNVVVNWAVTDTESDLTSSIGCSPVMVTADTAGDAFTCTASSAGGSSTLQTLVIKRDATNPTITYAGNAERYGVTDIVSITCEASDDTSGVASSTCEPVIRAAYTFEAGANTLTDSATDVAGNVGTGSATFTLEVTPGGVCELTRQFVRSSTAYEHLTPARKAAAQALTATICAWLSRIIPRLTPAQKALVLSVYRHHVAGLVKEGWLTVPQAATLTQLAGAL